MPTQTGGKRTNTRRMHRLRDEFFQEGKRLDAEGDPAADCWRCHGSIDYSVPANSTPDSHNLGHFRSVEDHPELQEDPNNFRHEHALCNQVAGKDGAVLDLGIPSRQWV